jgi:hypothetical protein
MKKEVCLTARYLSSWVFPWVDPTQHHVLGCSSS